MTTQSNKQRFQALRGRLECQLPYVTVRRGGPCVLASGDGVTRYYFYQKTMNISERINTAHGIREAEAYGRGLLDGVRLQNLTEGVR